MDEIKDLLGSIEFVRAMSYKTASSASYFVDKVKNDEDIACAVIAILAQNAADVPGSDGSFSEDDGSALLNFIAELGMKAGLLELIMSGRMMIEHDDKEKYQFRLTNAGMKTGKEVPEKTCDETKGNYQDNPLLALYDEVVQECDIKEVVGRYMAIEKLGNTQMYRCVCPFHQDHKPSMQINTESQKFKCLSCGASGDVVDFMMKYWKSEEKPALMSLAARAGINVEDFLKE